MLNRLKARISSVSGSFATKSFLLYSTLATLLVLTLILLVFSFFQNQSIADINSVTRSALGNMAYKTDTVFAGTGELAYQLFRNNNSIAVMMSKERDISAEIRLATDIEGIMLANPYLQSVYICNRERVLMRKDRGSYYDLEPDADILRLIFDQAILTPIQRKIPINNQESLNVISVIYHTAYPNNEQMNGAVVININATALYRNIIESSEAGDRLSFATTETGTVIVHPNRSLYQTDQAGLPYMKQILADLSDSGSFRIGSGQDSMMVNFVRAHRYGLIFISMSPFATITESLSRAKGFTILVCLIALLLLVLSDYILTRFLFRPMRRMVQDIKNSDRYHSLGVTSDQTRDEIRYISQTLTGVLDYVGVLDRREKDNIFILRNSLIWRLINDQAPLLSPLELERQFAERNIQFNLNCPFALVLLRLDSFAMWGDEKSTSPRNLLLFSVGNITAELIGESFPACAFETESDYEILLVNLDQEQMRDFLPMVTICLQRAQAAVKELLNVSVTAAVSDVSDEISQLSNLYRQALAYTQYRLIYGPGNLFSRQVFSEPGNPPCDKAVKDVLQSVKAGNRDAFIQQFDALLVLARSYSLERALKLLTNLYVEIIHIKTHLNGTGSPQDSDDVIRIYREISAMDGPLALSRHFLAVFEQVSGQVISTNKLSARDLLEDAIRMVQTDYADSQISGNSVARRLSLSPQYFSKLFAEFTGSSFPEYLNKVRLEKACALLLTSDRNAFEIGEAVGYANRSYFSTVFKKTYGVSPSKYRVLNRKLQPPGEHISR
jgi:AraC-like DNA-binding protein